MRPLPDLARFLADHDGVITAQQARSLQVTPDEIRARIARDEWRATARSVYRSTAHPMTEAMLVRSAALAHNAVVDRTAAAWWHGLLRSLVSPVTLAAPQRPPDGRWTLCDVDLVRRQYGPEDLTEVRGLTVTALPITVLLTALALDDGTAFADRMLQKRVVTAPQLIAALERHRGKPGAPRLRRLLDVVVGDSESIAERLFVRLLREAGIDGWTQQFPFGPWRLEFAWPDLRVGVEIQGLAFHRTPRQLAADEAKANALERAHWRRLGFTWHQLSDDPIGCITTLLDVLNQQADALT